jgi:hypothetical protein
MSIISGMLNISCDDGHIRIPNNTIHFDPDESQKKLIGTVSMSVRIINSFYCVVKDIVFFPSFMYWDSRGSFIYKQKELRKAKMHILQ